MSFFSDVFLFFFPSLMGDLAGDVAGAGLPFSIVLFDMGLVLTDLLVILRPALADAPLEMADFFFAFDEAADAFPDLSSTSVSIP